ncbi:related to DCG1-involved in nitrogen-catabolite metabolism [Ustilago bromivora]|uniref:Related to DCG1-involved in nitrogen-catabolite metabolism n=1 Tax=Ustilago bromivora TaxID=307758 RepID=A0A1K0G6L6_9BASI|nr:related to DCG1-involved in nitrogen-catabolite metabolism [Ustilago bromivora]
MPTGTSRSEMAIYIVNPNSCALITSALSASLSPHTPPGCSSHFITGPPSAPLSIQTLSESVASASETFRSLVASSANGDLALHPADAFLVACFSDHPLVGMLRSAAPGKPAMHLLEAALLHALCVGRKFGILTTGKSVVPDVEAGVSRVLGGNSDRYVATVATGLGVVELKDGCREKVEGRIKQGAKELVGKGADVVILGCAGMTGMEAVVQEGCKEVGVEGIKVVDGALAGMQLLAGLGRLKYLS